jgi:hypothetical protein
MAMLFATDRDLSLSKSRFVRVGWIMTLLKYSTEYRVQSNSVLCTFSYAVSSPNFFISSSPESRLS